MFLNLVPLGLYFGFLLAVLILGSRTFSHPSLFLLRSLFPSWQFFHGLGRVPRLYFRYKRSDREPSPDLAPSDWSDWTLYFPKQKRSILQILFNPDVNLRLLEQTLIEQLTRDCMDIKSDTEVSNLVSYQTTERLVRNILTPGERENLLFQFRVMSPELGQITPNDDDLVLQSPILRLDRD